MIEIDINPNFDARIAQVRREKSISDIVAECDGSLRTKVRRSTGASAEDIDIYDGLLHDFLCSYVAVKAEVDRRGLFRGETGNGSDASVLLRAYSIYTASKAALNRINDEVVEQLRSLELITNHTTLTPADILKPSDYSLLETVLGKLKNVPQGANISGLKYNYFTFFDRLREMANRHIRMNCRNSTLKELNQIHVYKTGLDFNEIQPPKKSEFTKKHEKVKSVDDVEKLPTELPEYVPGPTASLERVVGNDAAKTILLTATIRMLKYDPARKSNPFFPFQDAFLIFGEPGVGKNLTVDAVVNYIRGAAAKHGKEMEVVDLSGGILSMYKNRSASIFQRYIDLENEGNSVYLNIMDEADGVFKLNEFGEMSEGTKEILREMKKAINTARKGNALFFFMTNYAEKFEAALKQRFRAIEMKGPDSPEDFARVFQQELRDAGQSLAPKEFYALGAKMYEYKQHFRPRNGIVHAVIGNGRAIPVTGRDVMNVVKPFVSGSDAIIVENVDTILEASYDTTLRLIPQLIVPVTQDALSSAIDNYMDELKRSTQKTTAVYNS